MNLLEETGIHCPYCGEQSTVLVDCSQGDHSYIEDCQVCCKPMVMWVALGSDGTPAVAACSEDDA